MFPYLVHDVPADRPHFAIWPKRLPHAVIAPETSLWVNLDVAATRFPDKPAYIFFGRELTYRELHAQAEAIAGWLQSVGVGTGDRVAIFLQNCPQYVAAYYGILRANAVVVPVNPMNRAEEFKHYITDPGTKVVICSADLAAIVDARERARCPRPSALTQVLVTRYTDAMPDGAIDAADAPPPAMEAWLRADPPLPAGHVRWTDVLAAQADARAAHREARRPRDAAVHVGHDRAAEGLHAHASHADAQHGRRPVELCRRRSRSGSAWCRCSTSPACCTACSASSTAARPTS